MAHKKAGGSSRNGRDSNSKRLGVKKYGGEAVIAGNILVRSSVAPRSARVTMSVVARISRCSR